MSETKNNNVDVVMGTLYDLNKSAMAKAKALNPKEEIEKLDKELFKFFAGGEYFMMLCNEQKDYTVFALTSNSSRDRKISEAKTALQECLENRGELLSIEKTEDDIAYEIWLRMEEEIFVYYLFPYDAAIIKC